MIINLCIGALLSRTLVYYMNVCLLSEKKNKIESHIPTIFSQINV